VATTDRLKINSVKTFGPPVRIETRPSRITGHHNVETVVFQMTYHGRALCGSAGRFAPDFAIPMQKLWCDGVVEHIRGFAGFP
jgi:hypothetical protein